MAKKGSSKIQDVSCSIRNYSGAHNTKGKHIGKDYGLQATGPADIWKREVKKIWGMPTRTPNIWAHSAPLENIHIVTAIDIANGGSFARYPSKQSST